jgi:hypothetical protein
MAEREDRILLEALNSQAGPTTLGSPVQNGQPSHSAQGLQVAGGSSAVSGGAQSAVPAAGVRVGPWAYSRRPMNADDVAFLRKFNEKTNTRISDFGVAESKIVRTFGIDALADGADVLGTLKKAPISLTEKQARAVWGSLNSALQYQEKKMAAIRQNQAVLFVGEEL